MKEAQLPRVKKKQPRSKGGDKKGEPVKAEGVRCSNCQAIVQYRDSLSNNVMVVGKNFIHKRCKKDGDGARVATKLEQKQLKLHSEFVQCEYCRMIIDKCNSAMHILKCIKQKVETEAFKAQQQ